MAKDLILELGSEELPAGFIHPALLSLSSILAKKLETARVGFKAIETFGAPRRLAVVVSGLDEKQKDVSTEARGPKKKPRSIPKENRLPPLWGLPGLRE